MPVGRLVLLSHGFDHQLAAVLVERVQQTPVAAHPDAVDTTCPFDLVISSGPGVLAQIEHGLHQRKEGGIVIDVEKFLLGAAADSELRPAVAYLRRARRALISRTGTAWVGCRRRR